MEDRNKYGAIDDSANVQSGLMNGTDDPKHSLIKNSATKEPTDNDEDREEISMEDALTEAGFKWPQVKNMLMLCIIEVALCAELEGINFLGPLLLCRWNLNGIQQSFLNSTFFIAAVIGSVYWGKFADLYGRRPTMLLIALISSASLFGIAFSPELSLTYLSIFFAGFAKAAFFILYAYPTEIVGRFHRTTACFFIFISAAIGAVLGSFLAVVTIPHHPDFWRLYFAILATIHLIGFCILYYQCVESPRFLLISGKPQKALRVIQTFNPDKNQNVVLQPATVEWRDRGSLSDLVKSRECFKHVVIMTLVVLLINGILVGTSQLYLESLQNREAQQDCILVGSFKHKQVCDELSTSDYGLQTLVSSAFFISAFLAKFLSDFMGRRNFLLVDGYLTVVFTTLFLFCKPEVDQTILAMCTRVTVNTARVVTTMYVSELFPTSVRGLAVGIAMAGSETGGAVAPLLAQFLSKVNHPAAVMCFVMGAVLWVILMHCIKKETKFESQLDNLEDLKDN